MKHFFILLIILAGLFHSCTEKNEDFPDREPDVFFYKTEDIAPRDISCMIYNNDHDVFLGSENKNEVLHLGIHGWEVIQITNPQNINPGINCILYDDLDRLWIGTDLGLYRHTNGKTESVRGFESRKINCLSKNWLYEVWVGMDAKENEENITRINRYDSLYFLNTSSDFEKLNINTIVLSLDPYGYIGTNDKWLYRFNEHYIYSGSTDLTMGNSYTCGCEMNNKLFSFGTKISTIVYKYEWSFIHQSVTDGSEITNMCFSADTALWIGTSGNGLIRFKEEAFRVYDKNSAKMASDSILSVVPAGEKHILCSIPGGKVYLMPVNQ